MAKFYRKVKVKTATEGQWPLNMKAQHDGSIDFGQFQVTKAKYLPAGYGEINPWTYINMEPLPQPTWGEVIFENRIYSVPCEQIFKGFNDWKEDMIHVNANDQSTSITTMPYASMGDIVKAIMDEMIEVQGTDAWHKCIEDGGQTKYFRHTEISWRMLKNLESLGYKLKWSTAAPKNVNIMRILAMVKVYIDYYYNNAYIGDSQYNWAKSYIERDNGNSLYTWQEIRNMLVLCKTTFYDPDYFTGGWDNPNSPNIGNQESTYTLSDPNNVITGATTANQYISNNPNRIQGKDPAILADGRTTGSPYNLQGVTKVALNMLESLTSFLKRNQLAGGEMMTRLLARYGKVPPREAMKKSRLIGKLKWGMNVTPIFSNADTAAAGGEQLGSYAGYGYAKSGDGNESFKFELEEPAIILGVMTCKPVETYTQGIDGEILALTKLDLPTPEFDNVGVEMIMQNELLQGDSYDEAVNQDTAVLNTGFAFTTRYMKYKIMRDTLSGNFTNRLKQNLYLPYTMQRRFDPNTNNHTTLVHNNAFTQITDGRQYDRIFYSTDEKEVFDNFRFHHELEINFTSWMKPAYDYYDWEHEKGREIEIQNNGPEAN